MNALRLKSGFLAAALWLAALLAPAAARAEFGTTNFQLLQGWSFKDNLLGYDSPSGVMTTVTLNHFHTWAYGDNFAFADFTRLNSRAGYQSDLYGEWHPRLFLNKLLDSGKIPLLRNWGPAGEINQGRGFYAYLGGLGLDLDIPGFAVAGLNLFYRYDNFALHTWQVSPFWTVPFALGPTSWVFTGFLDVTADRDRKLDVMFQPELLLDLGTFAGKPGKLHAGLEWYVHRYRNFVDGKDKTVSAPQAMIQWTAF